MTESRNTESTALALVDGASEARAAETSVLALSAGAGTARVTESAVLLLYGPPPSSRVTESAVLVLADQVPCLTRWAQCWRIARRDGEVFTFTGHDRPLAFRGETYKPCDSLSASASELAAVIGSVGNQELAGIISDESITERDLYGGLFDRARLEIWMVPWESDAGEIPYRLTAGITGNLSQALQGYTMEVLTDGGLLQQRSLLQTYTPGCRWELGDARCGVDLDALAVNGTATAVAATNASNSASRRIFVDSTRAEVKGYFDLGKLVWTSGDNVGLESEIKTFVGGQFVLWHPMLYPIAAGDAYQARPGCDKAPSTCKTKFDNYENYGGFPDVPGRDSITQTPNAH